MEHQGRGVGPALAEARERLRRAEVAALREPGSVRLLLATKTLPADVVREAVQADAQACATTGARSAILGENRAQELVAKAPALADLAPTWHFIGPLQSNKVNAVLRHAACVQTVASLDLARRLAERAVASGRTLEVMLQVNVSGETTKAGAAPDDAVPLALQVAGLDGLRLTGFMTVGANSPDLGVVRAGYALLRQVRDAVLASGADGTEHACELSMGMSGDLEAAVAEGATVVRLGTAVFGARPRP
ncbi:YggS family pyridoxal phosphate-dependent enzyme [Actinotalea subterranea]|uniref:YggS family pyridoxal phosphate-dependent enzyme n=1 Tax=Actinotalea subterranea TaxID=2607497 RepID=UPI0011EC7364|nr:YggS family pyridoxal phosphate-dependent enzyme [Actinotalea subterranea]